MKIFSVTGHADSGKTTVVEEITKALVKRGLTVGTVMNINIPDFNAEERCAFRHKKAGASIVTDYSDKETAVVYDRRLNLDELIALYKTDFVILEGMHASPYPNIATASERESPHTTKYTFCVSGRIANSKETSFENLPIINALSETDKLINLILEKVK